MNRGKHIIKPTTISRAEFISDLSKLINESKLPFFVLESILKDFCNDIRILAQNQYEADLKKYNEELNKEG